MPIYKNGLPNRRAYLLFLLTAAVLFAPFLTQGKILFSNGDNLYNHYPNIILGHRSFRAGDFGLWNPYLFTGVDTSTIFHHHMLNPINWILLLVPESMLLQAITAKALIEILSLAFLPFLRLRNYFRSDGAPSPVEWLSS